MKRTILLFSLIAALIIFGVICFTGVLNRPYYYRVGDSFKYATLNRLNRETTFFPATPSPATATSLEIYQGKILFINFFASW